MDKQLCARFPQADVDEMDSLVAKRKYMNRSDVMRDLVRDGLKNLKRESVADVAS